MSNANDRSIHKEFSLELLPDKYNSHYDKTLLPKHIDFKLMLLIETPLVTTLLDTKLSIKNCMLKKF